ncbi:MAG: amino acid permease [Legionellales bacterium]|nr:amino acid permease [Legionellales bacterium]
MTGRNSNKKRVLSLFSLVMINIIAVDSLRSLPISAEYGFSIVFFYIFGAFLFLIPIALVAAELATGWPETGGLYVWVRQAFGKRWGLVTIWLQWIYNVVWYPTILSFLAATLAYLISPDLAEHKTYLLATVLVTFWGATLANCFGMRLSSWVSTIGAIIGTLLPMAFIILLGIIWLATGHPSAIEFSSGTFLPDLSSLNNLAFLVAVLFGLIGLEMSAVHAEEVKNPQKDYPRALIYSVIIILGSLMLASLAIAVVIPHDKINLVSGLIEAFSLFFNAYHMPWMIPVIAIMIIIGGISGVSTWVIGPTKGLLAAAHDGCLPKGFARTNRYGAPVNLLMLQAVLFTLLCSVFVLMPTINSSYWLLSALTAQLALLVYVFMFAAGIKLRYKEPHQHRSYKIPGRNWGMWLAGLLGTLTCLAAIALGFAPPADINIGSLRFYETFLISGIFFACVLPLVFYQLARRGASSSQVGITG